MSERLFSSLIGSSNSSGDTEVSSDTGSGQVQLDLSHPSPPYHLQVTHHLTENKALREGFKNSSSVNCGLAH